MRFRTLLAFATATLLAACSNSNLLPVASTPNDLVTVTLGALRSTPVGTPSGFSVVASGAVNTAGAGGGSFDFLYDIDPVQGPAFYPAEAAGVVPPSSTNPGLKRMHVPFDSIKVADLNGYVNDTLVTVDSGDVFLVRSAIVCGQGVPQYGKLEVLGIDTAAHEVTFKVIVDENCGYRGLLPGIPTN